MNKFLPGQVRIIAGSLRGSKLPVPPHGGVRPTSDRVRETVFNWLQMKISGRRALDLFAGTGALGFEAASRGAAEVVMVERDATLAAELRGSAGRLMCCNVTVVSGDVLAWLGARRSGRFDLVFLDPPFDSGLWDAAAAALAPWLADEAWIYVERSHTVVFAAPTGWRLHREGKTREVHYALYAKETA